MSLLTEIEAADPQLLAQLEGAVATVLKIGSSVGVAALGKVLPPPLNLLAGLLSPGVTYVEGLVQSEIDAELAKLLDPATPTGAAVAASLNMVVKQAQANLVSSSVKLVTPGSGVAGVTELSQSGQGTATGQGTGAK